MQLVNLLASLLVVSCRPAYTPFRLTPLPLVFEVSLENPLAPSLRSANYLIAAAPTYWTEGVESTIAIQGAGIEEATLQWSFDDPHIQILGDPTAAWIQTTVVGYTGESKAVIITCWVTPPGGVSERVRAIMDIRVTKTEPPTTTPTSTEMLTTILIATKPPTTTTTTTTTTTRMVTTSLIETEAAALECQILTGLPNRLRRAKLTAP